MQTQNRILQLENIKCGGCANFIESKLNKDFDLKDVKVDFEKGEVEFNAPENLDINLVVETLSKMGYPEIGKGNTIQKAKSYVSCMIGRMN